MAEAEELPSYEETLSRGATEQKALLSEQIAEEKARAAADVAELQRLRGEQKPEYERFKQKQMDVERMAPPPVLEKPPPAPRTQEMIQPSSLERSVGMASIFALLSVGMAKGSAIYGLKALGGFLTGAHAGNLEQADASIKDFNSEMKRVHDANEYSRQQYLDVFNNKKYTLEMQEHAVHLKALEMKDELMVQARREKGMAGVHDLIRQRADVDHKFGAEMQKYRQWEETIRHHKAMEAKSVGAGGIADFDISKLPPPPGGGQKNEALLKTLDPNTAELVKRMANYDLPTSGFGGMDVKTRTKLSQLAALYDPAFSSSLYGVRAKTRMEYAPGGNIGTNIAAINTITKHIDQFDKAFQNLNNSQVQRWNSVRNKTQYEFGDPKLVAVQVAGTAVADEMAKILKGGKASATEEDMKLWQQFYSANLSKSQAKQLVWSSLEVAGGRLSKLQEGYSANMGGAEFPTLYPDTIEIIKKHKPKSEPTPAWLQRAERQTGGAGGAPAPGSPEDFSKEEAAAALSPARAAEITAEQQARVRRALPSIINRQTGQRMILEGGKWVPE